MKRKSFSWCRDSSLCCASFRMTGLRFLHTDYKFARYKNILSFWAKEWSEKSFSWCRDSSLCYASSEWHGYSLNIQITNLLERKCSVWIPAEWHKRCVYFVQIKDLYINIFLDVEIFHLAALRSEWQGYVFIILIINPRH